jgi:hypothetical protein
VASSGEGAELNEPVRHELSEIDHPASARHRRLCLAPDIRASCICLTSVTRSEIENPRADLGEATLSPAFYHTANPLDFIDWLQLCDARTSDWKKCLLAELIQVETTAGLDQR